MFNFRYGTHVWVIIKTCVLLCFWLIILMHLLLFIIRSHVSLSVFVFVAFLVCFLKWLSFFLRTWIFSSYQLNYFWHFIIRLKLHNIEMAMRNKSCGYDFVDRLKANGKKISMFIFIFILISTIIFIFSLILISTKFLIFFIIDIKKW